MVGDSISATSIAPLTGTYKATGTATNGTRKTPFTVSMVVQQGVSATAADGTLENEAYALVGSLTVDGIPCVHTGSLRSAPPLVTPGPVGVGAEVQGDMALPQFTMDDGSRLLMPLYIADANASQLNTDTFGLAGDSCASSLSQQYQLGSFVRQP